MIDDFIQSNIVELGSYYDDKAGKVRGALFSDRSNLMNLFESTEDLEKNWEGFTGEGSTELSDLDDYFESVGKNYAVGQGGKGEKIPINLIEFQRRFREYIMKSF